MTKDNLKKKGFISFLFQKDRVHHGEKGMVIGSDSTETEAGAGWSHFQPLIRSRENKEVGPGYQASKLTPNARLSPTRLHLLKFHNMHTGPPTGTKCPNSWACGGHFSFKWAQMSKPASHWSQERYLGPVSGSHTGTSHWRPQVKGLHRAPAHKPCSWALGQLCCGLLTKRLPLTGRSGARKTQEVNKTFNSLKAKAYNILKAIRHETIAGGKGYWSSGLPLTHSGSPRDASSHPASWGRLFHGTTALESLILL